MKVKGLQSCAGLSFSLAQGEVKDLPKDVAEALIKAGLAEAVTPPPPPRSKSTNKGAGKK